MTDDLPFDYPSAPTPNVTTRRCRRHDWVKHSTLLWDGTLMSMPDDCGRCGATRDPVTARRGKNNKARGEAIEREIGHRLGLRRVGQFGGPEDLSNNLWAVQVKSGGSFSERFWSWLKGVPVRAGQVPLLVVTDAPGPGHKRRAVVIVDIEDWIALHGPTP